MAKEERVITKHPSEKAGVNMLKRRYDSIKDYNIKKHGEIAYSDLRDLAVDNLSAT